MIFRHVSIITLIVLLFFQTGCLSQFVKKTSSESVTPVSAPEITRSNDSVPSNKTPASQ